MSREKSPDKAATQSQDGQNPVQYEADIAAAMTTGQPLADDLLHAAHALPPDMIVSVEQTLDHLSTTVDLFDVPLFDDDAG